MIITSKYCISLSTVVPYTRDATISLAITPSLPGMKLILSVGVGAKRGASPSAKRRDASGR